MEQIQARTQRNQTMELFKLLAAVLVVFIHTPFPGELGGVLTCMGSIAVPYFFLICGYFNFCASARQVQRRMLHLLRLLILGTAVHLLYNCIVTELSGGSTIAYLRTVPLEADEWVKLLFLHIHPYAGHYWYLLAGLGVYLVYYLYVRFWEEGQVNYGAFYGLGLCLFVVLFVYGVLWPIVFSSDVPAMECRNGWFLGLPFFAAGLWLHQYQQQVVRAFRLTDGKLILLLAAGIFLSLLQRTGVQSGLVPFGMLLALPALFLLLLGHPVISEAGWMERFCAKCGRLSTWIYIFHLMIGLFYDAYLDAPMLAHAGQAAEYIRPLAVLGISLAAALVWDAIGELWKKWKKAHQRKHVQCA